MERGFSFLHSIQNLSMEGYSNDVSPRKWHFLLSKMGKIWLRKMNSTGHIGGDVFATGAAVGSKVIILN